MNYLGIDWGEKRIGLAWGDELGVAVPLPAIVESGAEARWEHLERLMRERRIGEIVVGYPLQMDGERGSRARQVDGFAAELERRFGLPVHRVDERLSSQQAAADLEALGLRRKQRRNPRQERKSGDLDSRAAALVLREFLEQRYPAELGG